MRRHGRPQKILILRHQLAVLQRRQPRRPRLDPADRALLATLLAVIPKARRHGLRLLVTPDTILRWHRDMPAAAGLQGPCAARAAGRPPAGTSGPRSSGWPAKTPAGATAGSTANWPGWECESRRRRYRRSEGGRHRPRAAADRSYLVAVPALPGRGDPGVRLLHGGPARWHPGLSPGRDRARQQAHQDSRSHFASHRGMDRPAGPQPDHGSRRASAPGQVHDPRPRLGLHRRVRRGPRRCRDPDRAVQRPDTAHETSGCILHLFGAIRG
jgi:hypothetical protein